VITGFSGRTLFHGVSWSVIQSGRYTVHNHSIYSSVRRRMFRTVRNVTNCTVPYM